MKTYKEYRKARSRADLKPNEPMRSWKPEKKLVVLAKEGDDEKVIHFGDANMDDFTQHKDERRRDNYLKRAGGIRNSAGQLTKDDKFSANYWAMRYLWAYKGDRFADGGSIMDEDEDEDTENSYYIRAYLGDDYENIYFDSYEEAKKEYDSFTFDDIPRHLRDSSDDRKGNIRLYKNTDYDEEPLEDKDIYSDDQEIEYDKIIRIQKELIDVAVDSANNFAVKTTFAGYMGVSFYGLHKYLDGYIKIRVSDHRANPNYLDPGINTWDKIYAGDEELSGDTYKCYGALSIAILNPKEASGGYREFVRNSDTVKELKYWADDHINRYDNTLDDVPDFDSIIEENLSEIKEGIDNAIENGEYDEFKDDTVDFAQGGQIKQMIDSGVVELKMYATKPEHAKIYGLSANNPLYVQRIYIQEDQRGKGIGKQVLEYIDRYAAEHKHDAIFGHIPQNSTPSIPAIKSMLNKYGYQTIDSNNDFWKMTDVYADGGSVNPWAVCTDSVGREDKDKYESCVRQVRKKSGITKYLWGGIMHSDKK